MSPADAEQLDVDVAIVDVADVAADTGGEMIGVCVGAFVAVIAAIFARVFGPTVPTGSRPLSHWNAATAFHVTEPKYPVIIG